MHILGEGYFEVTKNRKLPFRIHTQELQLTVLGTKFNFSNYSDSQTITTDLVEGHVQLALNDGQQQMDLQSNERMTYDRQSRRMTKSPCDAGQCWHSACSGQAAARTNRGLHHQWQDHCHQTAPEIALPGQHTPAQSHWTHSRQTR